MRRQFFRSRVFCRNGVPALLTGRQTPILAKSYRCSLLTITLLVVAFMLVFPSEQAAHEIPADVTVQALVKPDGTRLRVLVRVPLEAL